MKENNGYSEKQIVSALKTLGWKDTPANRKDIANGLKAWGVEPKGK